MREPVLEQIQRTITAQRLLRVGARIVVGVSGGADSVALLYALKRLRAAWKLHVHVAHLDHGLRDASSADATFVRELSLRWRLPVTIEHRDVSAMCAREGWSLEDGARRIRYQFLLDVARRQRAETVALAHTADDQAETVLMRLIRGTGLLGLGAIPIKRPLEEVWVVRPLLEVWRREILEWLEQERLTYRDDASNRDSRFVRNRIRLELLPLLEREYNPNIKGTLTQLAEQSRWDYAFLQAAAARQWKRTVKVQPPERVVVSIAAFERQPNALQRQLVRQAIQRVQAESGQIEFRHWLVVERLFKEQPIGTLVDLPGGVQLRREKEHVIVQRAARASAFMLSE